jgi:hypothetical protein
MDLQRFAITYQAKTDEELLALAAQPAQLTPEARLMLASEMAKREIVDGALGDINEEVTNERVTANRALSIDSKPPELLQVPAGKFLEEVLILYHRSSSPPSYSAIEPVMFIGFGLLYAKTTSVRGCREQQLLANA